MRKIIIAMAMLVITLTVYASVVYYGSGKAVFLEDVLELKSGNQLSADGTNFSLNTAKLTDVVDPTDAQDVVTKNYLENNPSGLPLMGKGSLITSNGTVNGEFTACDDGEVIVWDASETSGFKCESSNGALLTENHLGSQSASIDKSVAGRGIILRRPDGTLREIALDNNDNIVIITVP